MIYILERFFVVVVESIRERREGEGTEAKTKVYLVVGSNSGERGGVCRKVVEMKRRERGD